MGIADDTDEIDNYVLRGLQFELSAREHREEPDDAPTHQAPPQARHEPLQSRPPPEPRRSMPMSAPVHRDPPRPGSGQRGQDDLKLTEEERMIARASIVDRPDMPKLTDAQKEYLYAKNKQKYRRMVADGTYDQQRQR